MLYDLLTELKTRIEANTPFTCVILPKLPAVYSLNTAYIIQPERFQAVYTISPQAMTDFEVQIFFVTAECDSDRVGTISKSMYESLLKLNDAISSALPRINNNYASENFEACVSRYTVDSKAWMTAGKIPISTRLTLFFKGISW